MIDLIENRSPAELEVGDGARLTRGFTRRDLRAFAPISGDVNPARVDAAHAASDPFHGDVVDGAAPVPVPIEKIRPPRAHPPKRALRARGTKPPVITVAGLRAGSQ